MIFNAMSRVLSSSACSGASGRAARECATGASLLAELKATQLYGYTGRLELDANGDRLERYVVSQVNIFVLLLCFPNGAFIVLRILVNIFVTLTELR
jgi:hypothetical protein